MPIYKNSETKNPIEINIGGTQWLQKVYVGDTLVWQKIQYDIEVGYLYNWFCVVDNTNGRSIANTGWHVSTFAEWQAHLVASGNSTGSWKTTGTIEAGTGVWKTPNSGATGTSGFNINPHVTVLGGGGVTYDGTYANFWTSTERSSTLGAYVNIGYNHTTVYSSLSYYIKTTGFNVRLVRDSADGYNGEDYVDYDGNVYPTKLMADGKVWMCKNLGVLHYNNGDAIPQYRENVAIAPATGTWVNLTTGAMNIFK